MLLRLIRSVLVVASAINPWGKLFFPREYFMAMVPCKWRPCNEPLSKCEEGTQLRALGFQLGDNRHIFRTAALVLLLSPVVLEVCVLKRVRNAKAWAPTQTH